MDPKPKTQFSLRRMIVWVVALNLAGLFYWWVPEDTFLCGPLFLVKYWTWHRGVGLILTAICVPLLLAPLIRFSRRTVILAVVGLLLWFASYYVAWQVHLGV